MIGSNESPLATPALGAVRDDLTDLVAPCNDPRRPNDPDRIEGRTTFALAFSGGGFRATLAALGVVRFLADAGRLADVRFVSSVSGGSIANGLLACRWEALRARGFTPEAVEAEVIGPIVDSISASSVKVEILANAWRLAMGESRTGLLARALEGRFFHGRTLESLDPSCRFIINAANLVTGVRFAFERDVLGDYVVGLAPTAGTGIRVATAVAASAAVPGAFSPLRLSGIDFPCRWRGDPQLVDGGAYDNTGLQALDSNKYRDVFLVAMNAGGVFLTGAWGKVPIVKDLARAESLLYRQSTSLRTHWMVDRFQAAARARQTGRAADAWARDGILMGLGSNLDGTAAELWRSRHAELRLWLDKDLARYPTVFDRLDRRLCRLLIYRGWWLVGACLAKYYPELVQLPAQAPPLV